MVMSAAQYEACSTDMLLLALERQIVAERMSNPPSQVSKRLLKFCIGWELRNQTGPIIVALMLLTASCIVLHQNEQAGLLVMTHLRLATASTLLPLAEWLGLPDELCLIGNPLHEPPFVLKPPDDCRSCNSLDRVVRIREGPFLPADFLRDLINTQQPAVLDAEACGPNLLFSAGPGNATPAELAAFYEQLSPLPIRGQPEGLPDGANDYAAVNSLAAAVDGVCDMRFSLAQSRPDINSPIRLLRAAAASSDPLDGWAASWRNCQHESVRHFRRFLDRPTCLPFSASVGTSHLLLWSSHPGHRALTLPTSPEPNLLLLHQVSGTVRIELTPRSACRGACVSLQTVLRPGQLLSISNRFYTAAWLPLTMGSGLAVGVEAYTVPF